MNYDDCYIWSNERGAWWRPMSGGYCYDIRSAGVYTHQEAIHICASAHDGVGDLNEQPPSEIPVRVTDLMLVQEFWTLKLMGQDGSEGGQVTRLTENDHIPAGKVACLLCALVRDDGAADVCSECGSEYVVGSQVQVEPENVSHETKIEDTKP